MPDADATIAGLAEQVRAVAAAGTPLAIRGGGTRGFYGMPSPALDAAQPLDLSRCRGIVDYAPSELVLTAKAGTPLAEIEAALAAQGQMLAFEPPCFGAADTLGGCIATGLSGPRRMAAGPLSDFVLGTRLLTARGDVLRFGGEVMKNVAGYDVSRLLAGSLGVLGALVEVSIKVVPRPPREATRVLALDEAAALAACLGWRARPIPVSATAWLEDPQAAAGPRLYVRLSGNESAVAQGAATVGGEELSEAAATAFWDSLRHQRHAFFGQRPLWRTGLPPGTPPLGLGPALHEWGGTRRWLGGSVDARELRTHMRKLGGNACLYRRVDADPAVPTFDAPAPAVLRIQQRIKHEFDPRGIFNPGHLYAEL